MRTVGFCEIDTYCRRVLAKHWPGVPCHDDIRTMRPIPADIVCGGFPCQDISRAGRGAGLAGERSGLWSEFARIIREVRPRYAIVENVAMLRSRGLSTVLGDLAALGYDAEWHCIPASYVGAPHQRDRIWIVAHPNDGDEHWRPGDVQMGWGRHTGKIKEDDLENRFQWSPEPNLPRVAHGIPNRLERLNAVGNSLVPQIAQLIGEAIMRCSASDAATKPP
jgi:DNA (cytosine-5)-methyltransferase 1